MIEKVLFVINSLSRNEASVALAERLYRMNPKEFDTEVFVLRQGGELERKLPEYVRLIKKPDEEYEYDIAVAFTEGAAARFVINKVDAKRKEAYLHDCNVHKDYRFDSHKGRIYEKYDRIYATSNGIKAAFLRFYPDLAKITYTLPDTLKINRIDRLAEKHNGYKGFEGVRLLSVGGLNAANNFELAISTAAILKKRGFYFKWYIIGDGRRRLRLKSFIRHFDLTDNVYLITNERNYYPYLKECDVLVNTRRRGGYDMITDEAVLLEKAVVACDTPPNHEQLSYYDFSILTDENPLSVADAIEYIMMEVDEYETEEY